MNHWPPIICITLLLLTGAFLIGYNSPDPTLGVIENIKGIPYPQDNDAIIVTEQLAHVDLYLHQPALANSATLTIDFDPQNLTSLSLGIRENSFWLSYPQVILYQEGITPPGRQQQTISIPLTDKLQEADQSLDLMFFAIPQNTTSIDPIDAGPTDTTIWHLHNLSVTRQKTRPTIAEVKDYVKSIVLRERAL